jgi:hypothetical protein
VTEFPVTSGDVISGDVISVISGDVISGDAISGDVTDPQILTELDFDVYQGKTGQQTEDNIGVGGDTVLQMSSIGAQLS